MKQDEILENQIGDFGEEPTQKKLRMVGKRQPDLTKSEEQSMGVFLNKKSQIDEIDTTVSSGWIPMDKSFLGESSQFYPEDYEFFIKPASVAAIKNWTAIDETKLENMNRVLNEILKSCVSIQCNGSKIPVTKINTWDRFWFILKVREYTFTKGESKVEFEEDCPECDAKVLFQLNTHSMFYEFPDQDIIDKHWSQSDKTWYINPSDYDVNGDMIKLYPVTLEKDEVIYTWAMQRLQDKKKVDEVFLRFLPWLLNKVSKDAEVNKRFIEIEESKFKNWDLEMFNFIDEIIKNIIVTPSDKLKTICPICGEEVVSTMRFPGGIKSLFTVENKHRKFGTK